MSKPNKHDGFERCTLWMPTVEHQALKQAAKQHFGGNQNKSKFARAAIRLEITRQNNLAKTKT